MEGKKRSKKSLPIKYCDLLDEVNTRRSKRGKKPFNFNTGEIILSNGAVATWKPRVSKTTGKLIPKWMIVKGTNKLYMEKIRKIKRKSKKSN